MKKFIGSGVTIAAIAAGVVAIWLLPPLIVESDHICPTDRSTAIAAARQTVLWMLGGAIALVGLFFTWQRDRVAAGRARLDRDANLTARFTEAVSQLGHEKRAIRVGGVYALERIAFDSERDRQTILDTLAAYLRDDGMRAQDTPAPVDVIAAGPVIGRITRMSRPEHPTDLHGAHFIGADLRGAHLAGANLSRADVRGANFTDAELAKADFSGAFGQRSQLRRTGLRGANLREAQFHAAVLDDADLREADLTGAKLEGASFTGADLRGALFPRSQLEFTSLSESQILALTLVDDPPERPEK